MNRDYLIAYMTEHPELSDDEAYAQAEAQWVDEYAAQIDWQRMKQEAGE
jgi:hypothetical protein